MPTTERRQGSQDVTAILSKTEVVLDHGGDTPTHVRFAYDPDIAAGEATTHTVYVERVAWRDMGEPDTITATIEPGDLLNEA